VPLAPSTLEGLANLRGSVLPIFSLRRLFGLADRASDDASRVLVIDVGQPLGFVVDRVSRVVGVEPGQREDVGTLSSSVDTELLSGLIKNVGGHELVMVVNFVKLVEKQFRDLAETDGGVTTVVTHRTYLCPCQLAGVDFLGCRGFDTVGPRAGTAEEASLPEAGNPFLAEVLCSQVPVGMRMRPCFSIALKLSGLEAAGNGVLCYGH